MLGLFSYIKEISFNYKQIDLKKINIPRTSSLVLRLVTSIIIIANEYDTKHCVFGAKPLLFAIISFIVEMVSIT